MAFQCDVVLQRGCTVLTCDSIISDNIQCYIFDLVIFTWFPEVRQKPLDGQMDTCS